VIQHLDHGRVVLGEFRRPSLPRTHELAAWFRRAGVPCDVTEDLARAHWEKLVWNVPFNGLGVAAAAGLAAVAGSTEPAGAVGQCLTTDRLLADARWERVVRELMGEIIAVANALGHRVEASLAGQMIERTRTMGAYKPSTVLDFERGQRLELESLFLEPLRQARAAGVAVPRLTALCAVLQRLDSGR
jgi:2-dehydropantoate 2-reductase